MITITDKEILQVSNDHGTMNDFGKTFFTDGELIEFVRDILDLVKPPPICIGAESDDIKEYEAGIYGDKFSEAKS